MELEQYMQDNFLNARMFSEKANVNWQKIRRILRSEAIISSEIANKIVEATNGKVTIKDLKAMNERYLKRKVR